MQGAFIWLLVIWNFFITLAVIVIGGWWTVSSDLIEAVHDTEHRSVLAAATQLGRLDTVSFVLAFLGLLIALSAVFSFFSVKSETKRIAEEAAAKEVPDVTKEYMNLNAEKLVRACLSDPEQVSALHAAIMRLGIRDAAMADYVDTDADDKETDGE